MTDRQARMLGGATLALAGGIGTGLWSEEGYGVFLCLAGLVVLAIDCLRSWAPQEAKA